MSEQRSEYNDDRNWENIEFTAEAQDDYTVYIPGTGSETATTKYLNKENLGTGFVLRPSATVNIVQINNKTFRNPITVTTAGFSANKHLSDIHTIVIRTTTTDTIIRLLVT